MAVTTETFPFPEHVLKLLPPVDPEAISAVQDQVLETVRQSQDAVVKMVRSWAGATAGLMPALPPLPYAEQIPDLGDLVEGTFAFLDGLLTNQKDFAAAVLAAAQPVLGAADQPATTKSKATTGPAAKTTT
jgi:hypothetical protein